MKKQVLLLFAALLFGQAIFAQNIYDFFDNAPSGQRLYYQVTSDSTVSVTRPTADGWPIYNKPIGNLTIPSNVTNNGTNYSVTSIRSAAFQTCSGLTSVTIPNSVTSIGTAAFDSCRGLTTITIPNSVTSIGDFAFHNCRGLTTVSIPNSVTSIGSAAFDNCRGLTNITLPNSITSIAPCLFSHCDSLTSIIIPNTVTRIYDDAFYQCIRLSNVTLSDNSVHRIGQHAFYNCNSLTSFNFPNSTTAIRIEQEAFASCHGLTTVTFGNSVGHIEQRAFYNCSSLSSITFVQHWSPTIGTDAFTGTPYGMIINIPCGSLPLFAAQLPTIPTSHFLSQMFDFDAVSAYENKGMVQVLTEPSCSNLNAVLNAVPTSGYRFDHWSTGSTDNPYTLTVTSDTTIIGYFVANGTQGINEVGESDIHISISDGHINVEGVSEEEVRVYDLTGRMVQNRSLPSGVYMVRIGLSPARKVVVMN